MNSLVTQGILVQTGPSSWSVIARSASGVITFDGRTGAITLIASDVNRAFAALAGEHDFYAGLGPAFRRITASDLPSGTGTVTSVGASGPPSFLQWANSPVLGSGTLLASLVAQAANLFLAGPTTGTDQTPAFRYLAPEDFVAGGQISSIRTALGFGEQVHVNRITAQTIPHATSTQVLFTSERSDSNGFHSLVSNTGLLTVPSGLAGYYIVAASVRWEDDGFSPAVGGRQLKILFGSPGQPTGFRPLSVQSVVPVTGAQTDQLAFSPPVALNVGSTISVEVVQSSGGDLDLEYGSEFAPELGMWRIAT